MKKILVIQNKRIGDVLLSSLIAENMKLIFPDSHITYFVYDYTTGVLENNPNIDRIISVDEKKLKKIPELIRTIFKIRKEKYDIIFDPYSKFQSRLMCLFSGIPKRIGLRAASKKSILPIYTHHITPLKEKTSLYGIAIEDRVGMVSAVFPSKEYKYQPKIYLTQKENEYDKVDDLSKPIIVLGILGSTPNKSMPVDYMVEIIDFITSQYDATVLFNFSPGQKDEALEIYKKCKNKEKIHFDLYEKSIRGFICLMNQCDVLIANEGGSVHIAKALEKPTFTIYSPYISHDHWNSFEDGIFHDSIHLLKEKPDLFEEFSIGERKKIEKDPVQLYQELSPELIIRKLNPFLERHIKDKNS